MKKNMTNRGSSLTTVSIVIAVTIIVLAVIFTKDNTFPHRQQANTEAHTQEVAKLRLPNTGDHIRGNIDAPITIIEFSDFECSFCSRLHPILKRLTDENPEKVAWVYRHFPLSRIHSRARSAAIASECVANLGGNDLFWEFTDTLFNNQRSLGNELYEQTAVGLGINSNEFNTCMKDKTVAQEVDTDLNEAINSGGRGTPFSIAVSKSGKTTPFSGALPYEQILTIVNDLIEN